MMISQRSESKTHKISLTRSVSNFWSRETSIHSIRAQATKIHLSNDLDRQKHRRGRNRAPARQRSKQRYSIELQFFAKILSKDDRFSLFSGVLEIVSGREMVGYTLF